MLEWNKQEWPKVVTHVGRLNGKIYAHIIEFKGNTFYQFRGLQGADLGSIGSKLTENIDTAKKICEGMMAAWKHKLD